MRKVSVLLAVAVLGVGVTAFGQVARPGKTGVVSLRPATDTATPGFERVAGEDAIFVSQNAPLTGADVTATAVAKDGGLTLTISPVAASRLASVDGRLAIMLDEQVIAAPMIASKTADTLTLGGLLPGQAQRIVRVLGAPPVAPIGPTITVVPSATQVQAGQPINVDVFISGVTDLRGYQVAVDVSGGRTGQLSISDMTVDTSRPDFVFGNAQAVNTVDRATGRMLAAMYSGGVAALQSKYLGSYTLSSNGAAGDFTVQVRLGNDTMLRSSNGDSISHQLGADATINVGGFETAPRVRLTK